MNVLFLQKSVTDEMEIFLVFPVFPVFLITYVTV